MERNVSQLKKRVIREIPPLAEDQLFDVQHHRKADFDFPIHFHPEFEINLVLNSSGVRICGDSIQDYCGVDLVLIGPNTPHAWSGSEGASVVTIQFHGEDFSKALLNKRSFTPIREMLAQSTTGVLFDQETAANLTKDFIRLAELEGFEGVLKFLDIINKMARESNKTQLSTRAYVNNFDISKSRRIKKVNDFLIQNLSQPIRITEIAEMVNMSSSAFSHFFKKRTQRSFTQYVTELRIGHAARLLVDTEKNISEICFESGFNNVSNFNRTFKSLRQCTPSEFRKQQELIKMKS